MDLKYHQIFRSIYWVILLTFWILFHLCRRIRTLLNPLQYLNISDDYEMINILQSDALPRHLVLLFTEKRYINKDFVLSLAKLSKLAGIKQLTLCDPWSIMKENLSTFVNTIEDENLRVDIFGGADENASFTTLVEICKTLCKMERPLNADDLSGALSQLTKTGIEPDFLVLVGSQFHIGFNGFPTCTLRTTEIHSVVGFTHFDRITTAEFCALINKFVHRQRRFGR